MLKTLLALAFLPAALALPAAAPSPLSGRDDNPGCQDASFGGMRWTVEDFTYEAAYTFTTPAHQNSWGSVTFNLANPALTYKAACSARSSRLDDFFYGDVPYSCTVPTGAGAETTFAFSRPVPGRLDVNQTWVCSDRDPAFPTTIRAHGTAADLALECTDRTETNPRWNQTAGSFYSRREVRCAPKTFDLRPYEMTAVA